MPVTPGVFTPSDKLKLQMRMNQLFTSSRTDAHLNINTNWFQELFTNQEFALGNQTNMVIDGKSQLAFDGVWLQNCDMDVLDCSTLPTDDTGCIIDGAEAGTQSKQYLPNICFHKSFKVKDRVNQADNIFTQEEEIARGFITAMTAMDLELEKRTASFLDAGKDTLVPADLSVGAAVSTNTVWDIPAAEWTPQLIAKFALYAEFKDFITPKLLNGSNFYEQMFLARNRVSPGADANYDSLYSGGELPIVNNTKTTDALLTEKTSFLVDNANVAYFNTNIFKNTNPEGKGDNLNTTVWSVASQRLNWRNGGSSMPVMYDVKQQRVCIGNNIWATAWRLEHRGGMVTGPEACGGTNNQIVKIVQDCAACA